MNEIIPKLIPIYMDLVQVTYNLRHLDTYFARPRVCTCTAEELARKGKVKRLNIKLVTWTDLAETTLTICPCSLAATQLLARGFFPCSPLEPTVAINCEFWNLL
ncbi:hypothetical protein K438DRAFT_2091124 [Mycena galopus ATCC 62051]|nr:hypothetical protein K438DRAFT_2091124 [Mycena galopus ATCC 62051]